MPCKDDKVTLERIRSAQVGVSIVLPPPPWYASRAPWIVTKVEADRWHFSVDHPETIYSAERLWNWLIDYEDMGRIDLQNVFIRR